MQHKVVCRRRIRRDCSLRRRRIGAKYDVNIVEAGPRSLPSRSLQLINPAIRNCPPTGCEGPAVPICHPAFISIKIGSARLRQSFLSCLFPCISRGAAPHPRVPGHAGIARDAEPTKSQHETARGKAGSERGIARAQDGVNPRDAPAMS